MTDNSETLKIMKYAISDALESEASATIEAMQSYYFGKAIGVLTVSEGILNTSEYDDLWAHYRSEQKRFS